MEYIDSADAYNESGFVDGTKRRINARDKEGFYAIRKVGGALCHSHEFKYYKDNTFDYDLVGGHPLARPSIAFSKYFLPKLYSGGKWQNLHGLVYHMKMNPGEGGNFKYYKHHCNSHRLYDTNFNFDGLRDIGGPIYTQCSHVIAKHIELSVSQCCNDLSVSPWIEGIKALSGLCVFPTKKMLREFFNSDHEKTLYGYSLWLNENLNSDKRIWDNPKVNRDVLISALVDSVYIKYNEMLDDDLSFKAEAVEQIIAGLNTESLRPEKPLGATWGNTNECLLFPSINDVLGVHFNEASTLESHHLIIAAFLFMRSKKAPLFFGYNDAGLVQLDMEYKTELLKAIKVNSLGMKVNSLKLFLRILSVAAEFIILMLLILSNSGDNILAQISCKNINRATSFWRYTAIYLFMVPHLLLVQYRPADNFINTWCSGKLIPCWHIPLFLLWITRSLVYKLTLVNHELAYIGNITNSDPIAPPFDIDVCHNIIADNSVNLNIMLMMTVAIFTMALFSCGYTCYSYVNNCLFTFSHKKLLASLKAGGVDDAESTALLLPDDTESIRLLSPDEEQEQQITKITSLFVRSVYGVS